MRCSSPLPLHAPISASAAGGRYITPPPGPPSPSRPLPVKHRALPLRQRRRRGHPVEAGRELAAVRCAPRSPPPRPRAWPQHQDESANLSMTNRRSPPTFVDARSRDQRSSASPRRSDGRLARWHRSPWRGLQWVSPPRPIHPIESRQVWSSRSGSESKRLLYRSCAPAADMNFGAAGIAITEDMLGPISHT